MMNLGKAHMLEVPLICEQVGVFTKGGRPMMYPDTEDGEIVISAISYDAEGGYVVLTACENLRELQADRAWYRIQRDNGRAVGIMWYIADRQNCVEIMRQREEASVQ